MDHPVSCVSSSYMLPGPARPDQYCTVYLACIVNYYDCIDDNNIIIMIKTRV